MTTKIGSALCALALAVPGWMLFQVAGAATPPPVNKVLVLDNEQILEGDIDLQGAQYRVRRSVGEVWMPADCGCATHARRHTPTCVPGPTYSTPMSISAWHVGATCMPFANRHWTR